MEIQLYNWFSGFCLSSVSVGKLSGDALRGLSTVSNRKMHKVSTVAGVEQEELPDPSILADPESCFYEFKGVNIHYKVCKADQDIAGYPSMEASTTAKHEQTIANPFCILLFHGFGASLFSWERIQRSLSKMFGATVLAFDRPAFGLTSRPNLLETSYKDTNPYSTEFSVQATLSFIDSLHSNKSVLIGHSAGCITAVKTFFKDPDRVAGLILVAPAILALPSYTQYVKHEGKTTSKRKVEDDEFSKVKDQSLLVYIAWITCILLKSCMLELVQWLHKMADMVGALYELSLTVFLRSTFALMLIRMIVDKFGLATLRAAFYNPSDQVTENVISNYTKPLRAKGWDMALLEHIRAILPSSSPDYKPPISSRLHEITCPVLVVTGDKDRLVPVWNSRRISEAIPGSSFEVMKECGHIPQEEKADEFLSIVARFLETQVLTSSKCTQAGA